MRAPSADALAWRFRTSALGHPGHSHALNFAVAPSTEGGIVAQCIGDITKAANGEAWIERKSRLHCGPRFVQLPEPRQRTREKEMRERVISVSFDAPAQPDDRFSIGIEVHLGDADPYHPSMGKGVARRKAECLVEVRFGFCASAKKNLCAPDDSMSAG
jgi:hypothetical protein